ncbi:cytochrome-c peroxidase [Marinibaculum pumilum]|uniref:Cytochrome-c peroxidase n=1 Tax=Marinibaculum pumilum TaxID=1766165 RepID=A0ABV7L335_9PROT
MGPTKATIFALAAAAFFAAVTVHPAIAEDVTVPQEMKDAYQRPDHIPFPEENPYSPQKVALGKLLYFDTRLSGSNMLACSSCHNPGYGWQDGLPKGVGHEMAELPRRTPTILNGAWGSIFFWDGRAGTLEEQALGPITAEKEMNQDLDQLVDELEAIQGYRARFGEAFPGQGITPDTIVQAIATYERTVIASRAPFDDWIDGDEEAIPDSAKRGFVVFNTKARCNLCHSGWNFSDDSFHDIGLADEDPGRGKFLPDIPTMQHAFKTPGLRDLARRAPFMHDGSLLTLDEVVTHYESGGIQRPSLSPEMQPLRLTAAERDDLMAFLGTLTGDLAPVVLPVLPR